MIEAQNQGILVVDDDAAVADVISRWLTRAGYQCKTASDGQTALAMLAGEKYDLVVTDIMMPGMSGIDLLQTVKTVAPDVAVLMVTAVDDRDTAIRALQLGAYGYSVKPLDKTEILISVANALERRRVTLLMKQYEHVLEQKVIEGIAQIRRREEEIIFRLVSASAYRDEETGAHIKRIGLYSALMAESLGWSVGAVDDMRLAAPMHDVGKIGISDTLLKKPGKLTVAEFEAMKKHTTIGAEILGASDIPMLQMASEIALTHHEKWDGSGYPGGLAGEDIPESGRIVAVVDVFDALVHHRVYRRAMGEERALEILRAGRGGHFDPRILDCFMSIFPRIRAICEELAEPPAADLLPTTSRK